MFLTNTVSENLGLVDAAVIAVLGYAVVFFGLILLMLVVMAMGQYFISKDKKAKETADAARVTMPANIPPVHTAAAPVAAPAAANEAAPGSAGKLKLHDVEPKTAAMLMAIVANKMGKPLNELRFISIKEVK